MLNNDEKILESKTEEHTEDNGICKVLEKMKFITEAESATIIEEYKEEKISYFLDEEKKECKEEFFTKYPKALAYEFVKTGNKLTQLRKFYYRIVDINRKIELGLDVKYQKDELLRLISLANAKMMQNYVSDLFCLFMEKSISAIKDNRDFAIFKKHFEAVLCYVPREGEEK